MRAGFTKRLRDLLWAADQQAQVILEAIVATQEAAKVLREDWEGADSLTGLATMVDGGLQLASSAHQVLDHTPTDDADITDLDTTTPIHAAFVEWGGALRDDMQIDNVTLRLDPDVSGAGREVEEWVCRVFRLAQVGPAEDRVVLDIIGEARVTESGNAVHDVTFDFVRNGMGAPVGRPPDVLAGVDGNYQIVGQRTRPVTVVMAFAIKGDGEGAGNASWRALETGSTAPVLGGGSPDWSLQHWTLGPVDNPGAAESNMGWGGAYSQLNLQTKAPWLSVNRPLYASATATFTSNPAELDPAPTGRLEVAAEAEEPFDAGVVFELRATGDPTWYEVVDGDVIGEDNTSLGAGHHDLSAMPIQASYDLRVTLNPSASGLQTPIVRRFGVRELEIRDLAGAALVRSVLWGADAMSLKAEVTEAVLSILKTGERDFRDYFTDLFSRFFAGQIGMRVWIGHTDPSLLARRDWLHIDTFDVDDYTPGNAAGDVLCVSVLARLQVQIPPFVDTGGGDGERVPVAYSAQTIPEVLADLIDSQIALPARFRGELVPASVTDVVSKTIREGDGKDEADRLAYLAGYSLISSQGRVKAVQLMADQGQSPNPIAVFTHKETKPIDLGPGLRTRIDEFFVKYGFDPATGLWTGETRYHNPLAAERVRSPGVDSTQEEDEETAKWIDGQPLARKVAKRKVDHCWYGLMLWRIRPIYAHPHVEIGDRVVIQTDQFVGRSPIDSRPIRGMVSARATIVQQLDIRGTDFIGWVKSFDDIILTDSDVDITDPGWSDPAPAAVLPELLAQRYQEANVAKLSLQVRDPQLRLVGMRYKAKTGGGDHDFTDPTDGSWDDAPYTLI